MLSTLTVRAADHLRRLCVDIPSRRVGSAGNRAATEFFASVAEAHGFAVERTEFPCLDWRTAGVTLTASGASFEAFSSPYSPGCAVSGPLRVVETVEQLERADLSGAIALVRGDLAREPLMPKNFPFYNPDEHRRIVAALEAARPRAIIAATGRDEAMAGAPYPFSLIEDGDFDLPSVYMKDVEGERLSALAGQAVSLNSRAERIPSTACNVVARTGPRSAQRIALCAHIDAKPGTPGAIDNASGVTVLLLLAELLSGYGGPYQIELVALNGEDYYSNPGEQLYLARNESRFESIALGINFDGVGYRQGRVAYSLYECPPDIENMIRETLGGVEALAEGEPWYQGDHALFVMKGRPALAFTSEEIGELMRAVVHSPDDRLEIVNPERLAQVALAVRDLLDALGARLAPG